MSSYSSRKCMRWLLTMHNKRFDMTPKTLVTWVPDFIKSGGGVNQAYSRLSTTAFMVISLTASWIRWCMQVFEWWFNVDLSCLGRRIYARQFLGAKPPIQFCHRYKEWGRVQGGPASPESVPAVCAVLDCLCLEIPMVPVYHIHCAYKNFCWSWQHSTRIFCALRQQLFGETVSVIQV